MPNPRLGAMASLLADGRLHLQHGPIDLLISVDADETTKNAAFDRAKQCFVNVLEGLAQELTLLRRIINAPSTSSEGCHTVTQLG